MKKQANKQTNKQTNKIVGKHNLRLPGVITIIGIKADIKY